MGGGVAEVQVAISRKGVGPTIGSVYIGTIDRESGL